MKRILSALLLLIATPAFAANGNPSGFNGITGLTGDISASGVGSVTATLPTVNSGGATFQGITYNAKGLVTGGSNMGYITNSVTTLPSLALPYTQLTGSPYYSQVARKIEMDLPSIPSIIPDGDSITQGSNGNTTNPPTYNIASDYVSLPILTSGGKFRIIRNAGIGGRVCATMLANLQADVINYGPNVAPIMIGANDYAAIAASTETIGQLMNCVEQATIKLLDNSILPVIVSPPPNHANPTQGKILQWFYYQLAQYYGVPFIDIYKVWADPTSGDYLSGYSGDGTHPSTTAIVASAPYVSAVLQSLRNPPQYVYMGAVSNLYSGQSPDNLIANGTFINSTTPPTPNGWSVNTTNATASLSAATFPYTGSSVKYVKTASGGAYALSGTNVTNSYFSVGDTLYLSGRVTISGLTPATASGASFYMSMTTSSIYFKTPFNGDYTFATTFVVPSGTTYITPQIYVNDAGTYVVNNMTLVDVTTQNAIWQPGQQGIN